jgi:hypothetical protein
LDGRSDIWSLGAILYQMLARRRPFLGNQKQVAEQILKREPKPPRQVVEDVPPELEQICLKCLSKSVSARWETARDLADRLRSWLRNSRGSSSDVAPAPVPKAHSWWQTSVGRGVITAGLLGGLSLLAIVLPGRRWAENAPGALMAPESGFDKWNMGDAVPYRQYPLLLRAPRKLAWPVRSEGDSLDHDPKEAKLNITSTSMTLAELGEIKASEFRLDVEIFKNAEAGSSGLFWGFAPDPNPKKKNHFVINAVFLSCFTGSSDGPSYKVIASQLRFVQAASGSLELLASYDLHAEPVAAPRPGGDRLEVVVFPHGLRSVLWNGHPLAKISERVNGIIRQQEPLPLPWQTDGRFGVLNQLGSTLARNAHFTLLQGNRR